jgi:outer membrane protein TolC
LIAYKQAIQHTFGDVSDALIGYQKLHEVRVRQEQVVRDLAESVRLSIMRYQGGTTTYLEVLDGQRSLLARTSLWRRREATSIRASCNSIGHLAALGSRHKPLPVLPGPKQ